MRAALSLATIGPFLRVGDSRMSLPMPVGHLWVSAVTLPVSRESDEWYGRWFIYDQRPDLEENAEIRPLRNGITANFADEQQADKAAKLEGRRQALAMQN